jgi:transposase InsO family protein
MPSLPPVGSVAPTGPVIFQSDRGCQHTSHQSAALADELGVRLSVGRTGRRWDNALAESFSATRKRELLHTAARPSRAAARTAVLDFIEDRDNHLSAHTPCGWCGLWGVTVEEVRRQGGRHGSGLTADR